MFLSRELATVEFYHVWNAVMQAEAGSKSDLSSDVAADNVGAEVSSDPVIGKQASKPKDIVVFVNLVDFCRWAVFHS